MTDRRIAQSANNTRPAKLPALNVPRELENQLRTLLEAMKERLEVREGARGNPYERALTVRDLEQFKAQAAPATTTQATQVTASGITETRVKQLVGDALSVEINTLRAAIATVERALPTLTSGSPSGSGSSGVDGKEAMAYGKASPPYTKEQLAADLASGGATILSGALAGTTVMELDPAGNYVLFKHRDANINNLPGGYTGTVRTAVGITAAGFVAGYNRKSDGVWQNSIVIDSATGNVTILGTLKAGSVLETGATVGVGGTTIGTVRDNAAAALAGIYTTTKLSNDLAAGAARVISGVTGGTTIMELDAGGAYVLFKHRLANINGLGAGYAGVVRTATGITANGFVAGYNRLSDGAWQNSIVVESATGNVTILGTLKATSVLEAGVTVGVGGTPMSTIESRSATALQAADIVGKLNASGAAILTGPVTLSTTSALTVGTPALDGVAGKNGFYIGSTGIVGTKNGLPTFTLDNAGNATFKGNITGATGTFSGNITTTGEAYFSGSNPSDTVSMTVGGTAYNFDYSSISVGSSNPPPSAIRVGAFGFAGATVAFRNVGVFGKGTGVGKGIGVVGDGTTYGGYFSSSGTGTSLIGFHSSGGVGVECSGTFRFGAYTYAQPNGSATEFLCRDGTWKESLRIMPTNSGTAASSGGGIQLIGSTTSGIAGAFVGTAGAGNIVTIDVRATSPSDIRLKENIQNVTLGLDFVNKLRPVSYNLIADESKQEGFGFIAQEVEKLGVMGTSLVYHDPQAKTGDVEGHMVIHYPSYIAVLTKAVQELHAMVVKLQGKSHA